MIDVSDELTEALREGREALIRVREAAKSGDGDVQRSAMKGWLAAEQNRRAAWLSMATPLPEAKQSHFGEPRARRLARDLGL